MELQNHTKLNVRIWHVYLFTAPNSQAARNSTRSLTLTRSAGSSSLETKNAEFTKPGYREFESGIIENGEVPPASFNPGEIALQIHPKYYLESTMVQNGRYEDSYTETYTGEFPYVSTMSSSDTGGLTTHAVMALHSGNYENSINYDGSGTHTFLAKEGGVTYADWTDNYDFSLGPDSFARELFNLGNAKLEIRSGTETWSENQGSSDDSGTGTSDQQTWKSTSSWDRSCKVTLASEYTDPMLLGDLNTKLLEQDYQDPGSDNAFISHFLWRDDHSSAKEPRKNNLDKQVKIC